MAQIKGHISQIIGPVIDVFFDTKGQDAEKVLPKIHEALTIVRPDGSNWKSMDHQERKKISQQSDLLENEITC